MYYSFAVALVFFNVYHFIISLQMTEQGIAPAVSVWIYFNIWYFIYIYFSYYVVCFFISTGHFNVHKRLWGFSNRAFIVLYAPMNPFFSLRDQSSDFHHFFGFVILRLSPHSDSSFCYLQWILALSSFLSSLIYFIFAVLCNVRAYTIADWLLFQFH